MSQIEVSIYDQTAVFTNTPDIFSGGVGTDTVKFTFDDSWNTFDEKTAIFYNEPKKSYPVILNSTNTAVIPSNVIDRKTTMYFGVIGTKSNGNVKTSSILSYRIENGAITADTETPYPSTEVWLQILANYEIALKKCDDMSKNIENMNEKVDGFITMFDEPNVVKTLEKINLTVTKSVNNVKAIDGNVQLSMDNIYSGKDYQKYTVQCGKISGTETTDTGVDKFDVNVVFPKSFKSTPIVVASIVCDTYASYPLVIKNETVTGFTIRLQGVNNYSFSWIAIGDFVSIEITSQPADVTAAPGKTVTFTVTATGTGLTYQWQWSADGTTWKNTSNKTATYSTTASESFNGYKYRCVVTDANGKSVTSSVATLTVTG